MTDLRAIAFFSLLACGCSDVERSEAPIARANAAPRGPVPTGAVAIPGGVVHVGSADAALEGPAFAARIAPFFLDADEVTVERFARFAERTEHVSDAERDGRGSVFDFTTGTWSLVPGATFRAPLGAAAAPALPTHPATQLTYADAEAYCAWAGGRLPTEIEWEHAARDARDARDPWPASSALGERPFANVWTGAFPLANDGVDGAIAHALVGSYPRTALGLADLAGNVWEWTSSWLRPYDERERPFTAGPGSQRVLRGGSFLCERDTCHGFRPSARMGVTPDSALMHVGVRCAYDAR